MMKGKKLLAGLLSAAMVLGTMAFPAFADDGSNSMSYDAFLLAVQNSNYNYDGNGVTVTLKTNKGCNNNQHTAENCPKGYAAATAETPVRIDKGSQMRAQYQPFKGYDGDITIKNVKFVADTTSGAGVCINSGYAGEFTDGEKFYPEFQIENNGSLTVDGCSFDGICLAPYHAGSANSVSYTDTVKDCNFKNVYNTYGIASLNGGTIIVSGNTFDNCSGGIYIFGGGTNGVTISENAFDNMGENAIDDKKHTAGLIQLSSSMPADSAVTIAENTSDGTTPVLRQLSEITSVTATGNNFGGSETLTLTTNSTANEAPTQKIAVAKVGDKYFATLKDAVAAAQAGDTVTLVNNVTESIKIDNGKDITLDLNGKTLTNTDVAHTITNEGNLTICDLSNDKTGKVMNTYTQKAVLFNAGGATAVLNGGTFERDESKTYYTIKNLGQMTINDGVTVKQLNGSSAAVANGCASSSEYTNSDITLTINGGTFVQGLITIKNDECGILEINGGSFTNILGNYTVFNWNKAVINGGTFDATYVVGNGQYNENSIGDLDITNGTFNGFVWPDPTYPGPDISISGGTFSTDVSNYCADGFSAKLVNGKYVVDETANKIALQFIPTSDANVYDIVLSGDGQDINRLNTADFTFGLDNDKIGYTIAAAEGMTLLNPDNANRYEFHFNGKTAAADTAKTIKIGTVTFEGYGEFKFNVQDAETNLVTATTKDDNLVTEFVVNAQAGQGTLVLNDEANKGVINANLTVPTKKLTIKITFPNAVASNAADYQQMKAAIAGGDYSEEIALGAMENGAYKIEKDLAENTAYTVTVSGAGYRTARYTVMLNDDKTLNFWNNVADNAIEVELGNDAYKKNVTFLAGDIVKDNVINIYDLSAVVSYFGTDNLVTDHPEYAKYDLNRDGKIDSRDVAYVLVSWGK